MLSDSLLKRMMFCLCLLTIGCIAQPEYGDLEVQVDGRLSRAVLSDSPDSPSVLDLEFRYLIGANDIDGIAAFEWEYALIDSDQENFGAVAEELREAQSDRTFIYVEGTKQRRLELSSELNGLPEKPIVSLVVKYRNKSVYQTLIEIERDGEFIDNSELPKNPLFSQGY